MTLPILCNFGALPYYKNLNTKFTQITANKPSDPVKIISPALPSFCLLSPSSFFKAEYVSKLEIRNAPAVIASNSSTRV